VSLNLRLLQHCDQGECRKTHFSECGPGRGLVERRYLLILNCAWRMALDGPLSPYRHLIEHLQLSFAAFYHGKKYRHHNVMSRMKHGTHCTLSHYSLNQVPNVSQIKHSLPEAAGCALYATSTPFVCYGSPMAPAVQSTKFIFPFFVRGFFEFGCRLLLVEDVGQVAATTVLTVRHGSHEDTGTALIDLSV
jgi:hypothetical protein